MKVYEKVSTKMSFNLNDQLRLPKENRKSIAIKILGKQIGEYLAEQIHLFPIQLFEDVDFNGYEIFTMSTILIDGKYLNELERIATEYEANKRYIELGKAADKAFENKYLLELITIDSYGERDEILNTIKNKFELIEWAEREANDA